MKNPILPKRHLIAKSTALFLCFSMVCGCEEKPNQTGHSEPASKSEPAPKTEKTDPFQKTADRLVAGENISLEQLDKELKNRKWKELQPILLASIKKRSQEPGWTKTKQKKALSGYSTVRLYYSKRRRQQSLDELRDAIQKALKEEQARKQQ